MQKTFPTDQHIAKLVKLCSKNLIWLAIDAHEESTEEAWSNVIKYIPSWLSNNDDNTNDSDDNNDNNDNSKNDDSSFGSIKVIDIKSMLTFENLIIVTEMFATENLVKVFSENRIFCNVIQEYRLDINSELDFSSDELSIRKFEQVCDIIKTILVKQIPVNIQIIFETPEDHQRKIYDRIYNSYFGDNNDNEWKVMKQYQEAKCNQYCVELKYAILSLIWKDDCVELRCTNAHLKD